MPPLHKSLCALLVLVGAAQAQTTLVIDGPTRVSDSAGGWNYTTWKPMLGMPGRAETSADGYMIDPLADQQTGQFSSDFASSVTGGKADSGFYIQSGLINGVEYFGFRIVLNEYATTGNLVNIRVGFDSNLDGAMDLFMGPSLQQNQYGLVFQGPGTGTNTSPNTTTLTTAFVPTAANAGTALAFTSTNFSNLELSAANASTYYPGWTVKDGKTLADNDSVISFAIPLQTINQALAEQGLTGITADTLMRWVAFTATQNNSVNQDVYGLPKVTNSNGVGNIVYADFAPIMSANGNRPPVPEPETYGAVMCGSSILLLFLRRKRRASNFKATL